MSTIKVGDLVALKADYAGKYRGVTFRVTKVLPVNIQAEPIGGGRPVRSAAYTWQLADESPDLRVTATEIPYLPMLYVGQVVSVSGAGWKQPADQLYVVIRHGADETVKIAMLGGDAGRYWPRVPRTYLTVVDLTKERSNV